VPAPNLTLVPPPPAAPPPHASPPSNVLEGWAHAAALHWASLAKLAAISDPRTFGGFWLADLRQLTVDALRSPPFLALMKFNLNLLARRTPPSPP